MSDLTITGVVDEPSFLSKVGGLALSAEISAFDAASQQLFVVSGDKEVAVVDLSDPTQPVQTKTLDLTAALGDAIDGANSVAVSNGLVAVAVAADPTTDHGKVAFFDTAGHFLGELGVGALPDMLTFTPDGSKLLVANEAQSAGEENEPLVEPNPPGSISVISVNAANPSHSTVQTAGFEAFDGQEDSLLAQGVRIFPGVSASVDFEPEYITISPDGSQAFVALQENNAIAIVDIATATVTEIQPLGTKDHSLPGNGLDASNEDGGINIRPQPLNGLYMPDAIATFAANGQTYYITANEGDGRDVDEERVKDITLDPTAFPNAAELQDEANLGRIKVSTIDGDLDGDGDFDKLFSFGARSFTIRAADGSIVFDSGDDFEQIIAANFPDSFADNRSDDKGPEPEGVTVGTVDGRTYAFIGLERASGIMVYDITEPTNAQFVQFFPGGSDISPEGLTFIPADQSPNGEPLLVVTNEVSETLSILNVGSRSSEPSPFTLELLHAADQEGGVQAITDAPNFSAVLNALRAEDLGNDGLADNTLTLSAGDAIIPGLFFDASEAAFGSAGIADIQIQNELGFQAIALGNHEFDFGTGTLAGLIDGSAEGEILGADFAGAAFPYLSANLDFAPDANLAPLEVAGGQAPQANSVTSSTVIDVNGEDIGIVGATTPTLASISSSGEVGISPAPFDTNPTDAQLDALAAEIQQEVDALLAANPGLNKVVLLSHMQQLSIEQGLATRLENVDIIVGGGSNTRLFDDNDRPRAGDSDQGDYPQFFTNAGGTQTALVNTDGSYKYVGRLVIDFDADGNIIPESYDETVSGAYATDAQGVSDLHAENLVDPEIQAIVDAIQAEIIASESNVFGVSDVFLNGNRSGTFTAVDPDGVRTQETNLGNLTADANLAAAQEIDDSVVVSLKNGGGIRASIGQTLVPAGGTEEVRSPNEAVVDGDGNIVKPEGGISQNDIQTTLAFNNGLTLLTLTRAELVAVLEHGVSSLPDVAGSFPQISGIQFSFDPDAESGDRIQSAAIEDENGDLIAELVRDGKLVGDASETFRIVTLDFLARPRFDDAGNFTGGGDGYPFPNTNTDPALGEVGADAARVNAVALEQEGIQTGEATFADNGTEQDALAEYLLDNFDAANPFDQADVGPAEDERIQNLSFREDTVFGSGGNGGSGSGNGGSGGSRGGTPDEDILLFGNGNTLTLVGGAGNDGLYGSDKAETFNAGVGDDKIFSNGGLDIIDSGAGMDEVWLGGMSEAIVILSEGEGYDFIANYQMGSTKLKGFAESELTFKDSTAGVEIFKGDDKLAVVGWKTTSELAGAFIVSDRASTIAL